MKEIRLRLQPLTQESFSDFGDVIELDRSNEVIPINYGLTDRHHAQCTIDTDDHQGETIVSLFHSRPVDLPFTIKVMERHPLGSQTFINMDDNPYIVVVASAGVFDVSNLKAFLARPDQGVHYHKGTWHHYNLCLNKPTRFAVIDRRGPGNNCDEEYIPETIKLVVDE